MALKQSSHLARATLIATAMASFVVSPNTALAYRFDAEICAPLTKHIPRGPNVMMYVDTSASMLEPATENPISNDENPSTTGTYDQGLEVISANDPNNPQNRPGLSLSLQVSVPPYAWVANHTRDTVSKFHTENFTEDGRYWVGDNPSRTVVDADGNLWVGTRSSTELTKILWDRDNCPDRNNNGTIDSSYRSGNNVIQVNSSGNVFADECVLYHARPTNNYSNIRGLAPDANGQVWVGYSSGNGAVQSIDTSTFALSPTYDSSGQMRVFHRAGTSSGQMNDLGMQNAVGCPAYGLVVDSKSQLYMSNTCRNRLPMFDITTKTWKEIYFTPDMSSGYGITTDSNDRIWLGGWPGATGVRMFDPNTRRVYYYPNDTYGRVTGVAVEPGTGDVWASFYSTGWTGRLAVNESNLNQNNWTMIPTTKTSYNGGNISGVGNDLRGVGFDSYGNAWTMGIGSDRIWKLDPNTNRRASDLPYGKSLGNGTHYTYSDFLGTQAASFTAPSGRWTKIYDLDGARIDAVVLEAHTPAGTSVGVRFRALADDGSPTTGWFPTETNGVANFYPYTSGSNQTNFPIPQSNDNPFVAQKFEVDVRLSTGDKGIRPILYSVGFRGSQSDSSWERAQNIATGLSNSSTVPGSCTEDDGSGCDKLQMGLATFDNNVDVATLPGENTNVQIGNEINATAPKGLTGIDDVIEELRTTNSLKATDRDNLAILITDGKANTETEVVNAINGICEARTRTNAPGVTTYVIGLGPNSDDKMTSLFAAAGGTGACTLNGNAFDPCNASNLDQYLSTSGTAPYTQVGVTPNTIDCAGAYDYNGVTALKLRLLQQSDEQSCLFELDVPDDPDMYNQPNYPQIGGLPDPEATQVIMNHINWRILQLPYCDPAQGDMDCGLEAEMLSKGSIAAATATQFKDEGWHWANAERSIATLTPQLCQEIVRRNVKNVTTQVSCQCQRTGEECDTGQVGRCGPGYFECNYDTQQDECKSEQLAMPEVCNGIDDDCDGVIDDLSNEDPRDWKNLTQANPEFIGLTCEFTDACRCDGDPRAVIDTDDVDVFIEQSWENKCTCIEGLEPSTSAPSSDSSDSSGGGEVPAAGCSSGAGASAALGGTAGPPLFALLGLLLVRVRRRRED